MPIPVSFCLPDCARAGLAALAVSLPLLGQPGTVHAQQAQQDLTALPFEQLLTMEVYSASKFMQKANEAPATVTVITAADIRAYGWRTLGDVARSVRGMYVSYDRNYSYLGARGFLRPGDYNTRFLLQIDGARINDAVYDQAPIGGEFPLELDLIERIEFVPGPGSSIYGSNAFFGVINVITKRVADLPGARVAFEGGQFGAAKAAASFGWSGAGAQLLLAASAHHTGGQDQYYAEFDTPEQNHGVARGLDYERGARLYAKAASGPFSLTLLHAERTKGIPTASFFQPFNDPRTFTLDTQSYADVGYNSRAGASEQVSARLYWGGDDSLGDYINDDATHSLDHDGSYGRWWGFDAKLVSTRLDGHKVVAGLEYQKDYRLDQFTYTAQPYASYLDDHRSARRAGLYVQDEMTLSAALLLNLGLRYDRNGNLDGVVSPRVALIDRIGAGTTLKAIYGGAYRAPNSYELYYAYPGEGGQLPNPALHKERIASTELALVHQLSDNARLTLSAFRNVVSDLITQEVEGSAAMSRFENDSRVAAHGVEIEFERSWSPAATLRASVSHSSVAEDAMLAQVNAPALLAKLNVTAPLPLRTWHAGGELQYVGPRRGLRGTTGGFWLANLNLYSVHLARHVEAAVSAFNLLNRHYADPGSTEHVQQSIGQDGRSLRAKVSYVF
jgi:outer membrane receptor protein involved in Fe transport